jgi:deoxycytidylate deaminase
MSGMNVSEKWDRRFLELAEQIAGWSKDPSRGVGAVIVNAMVVSQLAASVMMSV